MRAAACACHGQKAKAVELQGSHALQVAQACHKAQFRWQPACIRLSNRLERSIKVSRLTFSFGLFRHELRAMTISRRRLRRLGPAWQRPMKALIQEINELKDEQKALKCPRALETL